MIILEIDIDMPPRCMRCPFCIDFKWCAATENAKEVTIAGYERREDWCPLKEVKEND